MVRHYNMEKMSEIIRREFARGDDIRDAGLTSPADILRWNDIVYAKREKFCDDLQKLDVYRPKEKEGKLPVIVSVHGGGWVYGDKERYQYYCMDLAQRGFCVVNFSYRLAPEWKFPAALEDTNMVFGWVLEHAREYGMDVEHIFAVGDSAGAHILSLYLNMCTNESCENLYGFKVPENLNIRAAALNCGQYHIDEKDMKDDMTGKLMEEYLPEKSSTEELQKLCADKYLTDKFPPAYIMTAEEDFLKEQAPSFYERLKETGVPCELHEYTSEKEKLGHVFHLNIRSEAAKQCNDAECRFFERFIK